MSRWVSFVVVTAVLVVMLVVMAGHAHGIDDHRVVGIAQAWADHLAQADTGAAHNPQLRPQTDSVIGDYAEVAENVGSCTCSDPGVVVAFWHSSPTHESNLAKRWDLTGFATATSTAGVLYVVEDFVRLNPPPTTMAPDPLPPAPTPAPVDIGTAVVITSHPVTDRGLIPAIAIVPPPATAGRVAAQLAAVALVAP